MRCLVVIVWLLVARDAAAQAPVDLTEQAPPRAPRGPFIRPQTTLTPILIEPDKPQVDPTRSPTFVMIDRFDATSAVGSELTAINLVGTSRTLFRSQIAGHYVDPQRNVGGYLQMPASFGTGDFASAVGNLEVGGILIRRNVGGPTNAIVVRAGVTVPTGSITGDNLPASIVKPADVYLALPGATSLRLGISSLFRNNNIFGRVDLGFDVNFDQRGSREAADPVIRLNAGFGVDLGHLAVIAEVSNVYIVNGPGESRADNLLNIVAISLRVLAGRARPYLSFIVPFDSDSNLILEAAFTIGFEAKL